MRRSHLTRHPVNDVSRSETEDRLGNERRHGSNDAENRHGVRVCRRKTGRINCTFECSRRAKHSAAPGQELLQSVAGASRASGGVIATG